MHGHNVLSCLMFETLITHYRHPLVWHAYVGFFNCFCIVVGEHQGLMFKIFMNVDVAGDDKSYPQQLARPLLKCLTIRKT